MMIVLSTHSRQTDFWRDTHNLLLVHTFPFHGMLPHATVKHFSDHASVAWAPEARTINRFPKRMRAEASLGGTKTFEGTAGKEQLGPISLLELVLNSSFKLCCA